MTYKTELFAHEASDSSSTSDSNSNVCSRANFSDEEVVLASNNPKRRAGRKKFRETRHPIYRGVRRRDGGKWVSEIRQPNKKSRIWLGTFPTPEMAARAHDVTALALRGRSACLNYADCAFKLPVPASVDGKDIRKAAAEAFKPLNGDGVISGDGMKDGMEMVVPPLSPENVFFMDEEEVFSMPRLLDSMAEALLLPPPHCGDEVADVEAVAHVSLWSYSV